MPLFGKKKKKEPDQRAGEVKSGVLDEILAGEPAKEVQPITTERPRQSADLEVKKIEEVSQPEKPAFAPLFIKIDRYRQILNTVGQLKSTMIMIKNSLVTLNELEKARDETYYLIKGALDKIDQKISTLDSEMIRPTGYHQEPATPVEEPVKVAAYHDAETVEATIADLKGQIEELKSELTEMT